jgi:hypothetical protein
MGIAVFTATKGPGRTVDRGPVKLRSHRARRADTTGVMHADRAAVPRCISMILTVTDPGLRDQRVGGPRGACSTIRRSPGVNDASPVWASRRTRTPVVFSSWRACRRAGAPRRPSRCRGCAGAVRVRRHGRHSGAARRRARRALARARGAPASGRRARWRRAGARGWLERFAGSGAVLARARRPVPAVWRWAGREDGTANDVACRLGAVGYVDPWSRACS